MRYRVRKTAHVLARIGLAMAGAACGLFVGAYVGSAFAALTTQGFLLLMMMLGAIGFYLGIDTPQLPFDEAHSEIDAAEPAILEVDQYDLGGGIGLLPDLADQAGHRFAAPGQESMQFGPGLEGIDAGGGKVWELPLRGFSLA